MTHRCKGVMTNKERQDLALLKNLRGMGEAYKLLLWTLFADWESWEQSDCQDEFPGERKQRADAYDTLVQLLAGVKVSEFPETTDAIEAIERSLLLPSGEAN